MDKKQLVAALRELMKQNQVDAVYITGCCVVTLDKAAFWSDGRYVAQMVRELSCRNIHKTFSIS